MTQSDQKKNVILEVSDLTKSFGGLLAVDIAQLKVEEGEIRGIIGPNGAGKSTLLQLIMSLQTPDRGTIRFRGKNITKTKPHMISRFGIGFKFQTPNVYNRLSVEDNLRIPTQRVVGTSKIPERIGELLSLANLEPNRHESASNLSHGQKVWLEIAMTVATNPELLLLDEPTAGMTTTETTQTGKIIEMLVKDGKTVIVVEHDIEFVRQFSSQVSFMHNGQIMAEGTMDELESDAEIQRVYLGEQE